MMREAIISLTVRQLKYKNLLDYIGMAKKGFYEYLIICDLVTGETLLKIKIL